MSLISHWRERKEIFGGFGNKPLWWLITLLFFVLLIAHLLSRFEKTLSQ
jgi:hypothetical protein